jgi:hypothetical protein
MTPETHSSNFSSTRSALEERVTLTVMDGSSASVLLYMASGHPESRCHSRGPTISPNSLQTWEQLTCRETSLGRPLDRPFELDHVGTVVLDEGQRPPSDFIHRRSWRGHFRKLAELWPFCVSRKLYIYASANDSLQGSNGGWLLIYYRASLGPCLSWESVASTRAEAVSLKLVGSTTGGRARAVKKSGS